MAFITGLCVWLVIVSGAFLRNAERASGQSQAPLFAPVFNATSHRWLSLLAAVLVIAFAATNIQKAKWSSVAAVVLLALGAAIGFNSTQLPSGLAFLHACVAHLLLSCIATISVWRRAMPGDPIVPTKFPSLPSLALATPAAVFVQIALGAAYRDEILSVMPHFAIAFAVAIITLVVSVVILQMFGQHAVLRGPAVTLLSIVFVQIALGIAAFVLPLIDADNTLWFALVSVGHVATGALAMASSVTLALTVRRNVVNAS